MIDEDQRPNPDALLKKVQEEAARERRGKLKIFFGFAPGVGKTYRMLQVARDLVTEQNADVVIGLVETHRRSDTAALMLGLEILPRKQLEYRGRMLEEFDLDAALARRPRVLLLDELAHTNVAGSRHAKRWEDALELLDAGIDVYTTVNVQHVESLNDVVAQITHVQVRETVPDSILERADELELVDIAPEELLSRLREGKVYLPDAARRAVDHFFQRGNLLALRELALRRVAQHVDHDVQEYREEHGVVSTWSLGERILVCVGPAPNSGRLIRAAARMAAGLRAPWVAAYVAGAAMRGLTDADRERLEAHLRLAESLGAQVVRLAGPRISTALLDYARKYNVTRVVIGKPTHSALRDRLKGSLLDEVVRGSVDIEVSVIAGEEESPAERTRATSFEERTRVWAYAVALLIVAATSALAALVRVLYPVPDIVVLYFLAILFTAVRLGRGPSIFAAALSVVAYDVFFVPPVLTLVVDDVRYVLSFGMMFGVGYVVSELTSRLRREEQEASHREERTAALFALTRELSTSEDEGQVAAVVARHASDAFAAHAFVLLPDGEEALTLIGAAPAGLELDRKELGVARWVFEHGRAAGLGTDTLPGSRTICVPLTISGSHLGVLAISPRGGTPLGSEQRQFLEAFGRQAALALERVRLSRQARTAALRARTEEMRSSLLSAVSHDLRTPLAAITGAATTLSEGTSLPAATREELLGSITLEARRLERLVANLLDMTRLQSGAVKLKKEWVPLEEIIGSALTRLEERLRDREVKVTLAEDLPLAFVDPVLFEQVFVNLFENAAKYTPAGSPLEVRANAREGGMMIEVLDRGPGLPLNEPERVFEKFYRGANERVAGVGLGLAICRGIVDAHGGSISAANREEGGAAFRIALPVGGIPPKLDAGESSA